MSQARNWAFTLQATEAQQARWDASCAIISSDPLGLQKSEKLRFYVYQVERAPVTGKLHFQGTICAKSSIRMTGARAIIGGNPHLEICKDLKASIEYCQKAETRFAGPWMDGNPPIEQGKRKDLTQLWDDIKKGKTIFELLEENPSVSRFEKNIRLMKFAQLEKTSDRQNQGVNVMVFYGETALGKTYHAMNIIDPGHVFKMDPPATKGTLWWDGYEGERTLLLDEFEGENYCNLNQLKTLLDVYKCRLPIKGGHTWAAWTTVILCSNSPPRSWYNVAPCAMHMLRPLIRRITEIRHFTARSTWNVEDWDGNVTSNVLAINSPPSSPRASAPIAVPDTPCFPIFTPAPINFEPVPSQPMGLDADALALFDSQDLVVQGVLNRCWNE